MLDADIFLKNSPFQITHGSGQQLDNTTPELLKFSLQEQHRNKLRELKDNHHDLPNLNLLHSQFLQDSFNNHLQKSLDDGIVVFDDLLSSSANTTSNSGANSNNLLSTLPDTSISSSYQNANSNGNINGNGESTSNTTPNSISSASFDNGVINKPNYLNLKVLIENSVFDTKNINKDSILSLASLKQLKIKISENQELKEYLLSKFAVSQQFMTTMILNPEKYHDLDIDNKLLLKIIKLNDNLQKQLFEVVEELERLNTKLNNHNLACLVLGYVEDIKITSISNQRYQYSNRGDSTSPMPSPLKGQHLSSSINTPSSERFLMMADTNKSFDTLFSHIASIAAKRNIVLPSPPIEESNEARVEWATRCIDSILIKVLPEDFNTTAHSIANQSSSTIINRSASNLSTPTTETSQFLNESSIISSPNKGSDKLLMEYKTALNDLRFSHQYLSKEYEHSRETSFKVIQEFKKKNSLLEKENNRLKQKQALKNDFDDELYDTNTNTNSNNESTQQDLESKEREISRLRKELNLFKIENLGMKPATLGGFSPTHNISAQSLVISNDYIDDTSGDNEENISRPVSSSGMSNGILRKEFKKIVSNIQDQYEVELGEERMRRRQLEEQLLLYEHQ